MLERWWAYNWEGLWAYDDIFTVYFFLDILYLKSQVFLRNITVSLLLSDCLAANLRCCQAMQVLDIEGSHNKALRVLKKAETSMNQVDEKGTDWFRLTEAKYLFTVGRVYQEAFPPERSLEEFLESLRIMDQLLGDHTDKARCLNAIGNCYQHLEASDSAIEYFKRAHDMRESLSGEEHYDMPMYKSQIGAVFDHKGDYDKAIEWYQSAIDLEEKLEISGFYENTAAYYRNIANAYIYKGQYAEAVEPAQKAYDIRKEVLGDHPDTTRSIFQLGLIWNLQEEREKAVTFYKEAWEMEKSLEKGHHSAVRDRIVEDLRELYDDLHRKKEKRLFEEDALNFYCRIWDEEKSFKEFQFSASTRKIIHMIIDLYKALGSKEAELKMYQREVLKLYKDAWEKIRGTLAELKGDKTREIVERVIKARGEILVGIIEFVQALHDKELVKELVSNKAEMKKFQEEALHSYEKIWEQRDTLAELKWDRTRAIEEGMIEARHEILERIIKLAEALHDEEKLKLFKREKQSFYKEVYFAEGFGDIIKEHMRPEKEEQCTRREEFPVELEGNKLIIN